jgi:hypothetical protein
MRGLVVDTDVLSFIFEHDTRAAAYWPHLAGNNLHISLSTVAELYRWAVKSRWGNRRVRIFERLCDITRCWFMTNCLALGGSDVYPRRAGGERRRMGGGRGAAARIPVGNSRSQAFRNIPGLAVISEA